jgi:translocation and assembly module TamB
VKRLAIIGFAAGAFVIFCIWFAHGLLFTTKGINWFMTGVNTVSSLSVSADTIQGTLARGFRVDNMRVAWKEGALMVSFLEAKAEPIYLLSGRLSFSEARLGSVTIEDRLTLEVPIDLTLPSVGAILARIGGRVKSLSVAELAYKYRDEAPEVFRNITATVDWDDALLDVNILSLETPMATVKGRLGLSFLHPALQVDGTVELREPLLGHSRFAVNAMLRPARLPEQMAGALSVTAKQGLSGDFYAKADVGLAKHAVSFRNMVLSEEGRRGVATGSARITFTTGDTAFAGDLALKDVDLFRGGALGTSLSGTVAAGGTFAEYKGTLTIADAGASWRSGHVGGHFSGNRKGMEIVISDGSWLNGQVGGRAELLWSEGFSVKGTFKGRALDPNRLHADLRGTMNPALAGHLRWTGQGPPLGRLSASLDDSILQGRRLSGRLEAVLAATGLRIERALLEGRGFRVTAHGSLDEKIEYDADVTNISGLFPSGGGAARALGWVRHRKGRWAGAGRLEGRAITVGAARCARVSLEARLDEEAKGFLEVKGSAANGEISSIRFDSALVAVVGTLDSHRAELAMQGPQGSGQVRLDGTFANRSWSGTLGAMNVNFPKGKPLGLASKARVAISQERLTIASLALAGADGEHVEGSSDIAFSAGTGFVHIQWDRIDLSRINPFLEKGRALDGRVSGRLKVRLMDSDRMDADFQSTLKGSYAGDGQKIDIVMASTEGVWNERGLKGSVDVQLKGGGSVRGSISSSEPGRPKRPEEAVFSASWDGIDIATTKSWLPSTLLLEGYLGGRIEGRLLRGGAFDAKGEATVAQGSVGWQERDSFVKVRVKTATLQMAWRNEALKAEGALDLEEKGSLRAQCLLPIVARYPFQAVKTGSLNISVAGHTKELGVLSVFLRGAVRETRGRLKFEAGVSGTWEKPHFNGHFVLAEAAAHLPALGIRLEEVNADVRLSDDRIEVASFEGRSGPGQVKGVASFYTKDWRISHYKGMLSGQRFQALFLPEVQAVITPTLVFEGVGRDFSLGGEIKVPEASLLGRQGRDAVRASSDVVITDKAQDERETPAFPISGKVRIILGEQVTIRMDGLEGLLTGDVLLTIKDSKSMAAAGEVQIVKGGFSYYGQRLDIERGRIIFGGPPDNPSLDILALKKVKGFQRLEDRVGEVRAGVAVTGSIKSPFYRLYSQPPMPDVDVLSYILLGRKTTRVAGKDSSDAMLGAAGALVYGGLKGKIGSDVAIIDSVDIQSGGKNVSQSLVTVGKYLNPRLYLGLGGSLFSNTYQIILRYSLSPSLDVETRSGTESGGSIYYKIEFD